MNKAEYNELVAEWRQCDSIKLRDEIADRIYCAAVALLKKLNCLYAKYGRRFVVDDDYDEDRGYLTLREDRMHDDAITLNYTDSLFNKGDCDINIVIPTKYLDEWWMTFLETELERERVEFLRKEIEKLEAAIKHAEKSIEEDKAELEALTASNKDKPKMNEPDDKKIYVVIAYTSAPNVGVVLFEAKEDAIAYVLDELQSYPEYDSETADGRRRLDNARAILSEHQCVYADSSIIDSDVDIWWRITEKQVLKRSTR